MLDDILLFLLVSVFGIGGYLVYDCIIERKHGGLRLYDVKEANKGKRKRKRLRIRWE